MAALMFPVPEETARILNEVEVPGTPETHHLHTTVVHLGKDIPIEQIAELLPVLYQVTSRTLPFSISTDLITTFPEGEDGVPVIAKVSSPELHAFRKSICGAMDDAAIDYGKKFPVYNPHVTVAYATDQDAEFELEIPEISWSAHELMLWGSDRGTGRLVVKFPLSFPTGKVASEHAYQRALVQLAMWGKRDRYV